MLALAGCNAGNGNAAPAGNSTPGGSGSGAAQVSPSYEFSQGESYTYAVNFAGWPGSSVTYDVVSVRDGTVTVNVTSRTPNSSQTNQVTAPRGETIQRLENTSSGFVATLGHFPMRIADGHDLERGNSWTVDAEELGMNASQVMWEQATVNVTGTRTVAGVSCTELTVTPDNDQVHPTTTCVRPGWPFALSFTSGDGQQQLQVRLTEHQRP